ncbi:MAG TPA: phosphosulfolactate synthase [Burkholderiaceae bacterium]|jgi:phosphosulfolactate synthase
MHNFISKLSLPVRTTKPRRYGLTLAIDTGCPFNYFRDVVESHSSLIDYVKFGWGTALVTDCIERKIDTLHEQGFNFLFGGTLFEKFFAADAFSDYLALCTRYKVRAVEISSGSISLTNDELSYAISRCRDEGFAVFCEIGKKGSENSSAMSSQDWIDEIAVANRAGADYIVLEARESGTGGIFTTKGDLREGLLDNILDAGIDQTTLVFEAPMRHQQAYFIRRFGPDVNLANIALADLVSLETLRQNLRFETFDMVTS